MYIITLEVVCLVTGSSYLLIAFIQSLFPLPTPLKLPPQVTTNLISFSMSVCFLSIIDLQHYFCFCYIAQCVLSLFSHVQLFVTLWTLSHQVPLSTGSSRQEYWSGLPCPPPGNLLGLESNLGL